MFKWGLTAVTALIAGLFLLSAEPVLAARDSTGFTYQYVKGNKYYRVSDIARHMRLRLSRSGKIYELRGNAGRMVFNPEKRFGSFNNIVITYDFAPVLRNGELYISSADFFNHLQVLFNPNSLRKVGVRTILIDPGHGGNDKGASGARFAEKVLTLQIAMRLQLKLKNMGYRVYLTRVNDRRLELKERAAAANSIKADMFISIHMNAASNRSVQGIETFSITAYGSPSSGSDSAEHKIYPGNRAMHNSTFLAWHVQNNLIRSTGGRDRGMKHARFVVLRETQCPAILVECGFISNRTEENMLASAAYQEKIAYAIARGIYDYHVAISRR